MMKNWELIKHLAMKEIKSRYKQSFLGVFWVVLNPFFQMLIMSFIFSKIIKLQDLGVPYPVYVYAGLLPWLFLANSLTSSTQVLIDNAALIKKIYFPREILILATISAKVFDFSLALLVFFLIMAWYHVPFTLYILLFLPIFLVQLIFVFGLSLLLAMFNLYYRDFQYLLNLIISLWFYVTPVLYAVEFFPTEYQWIFKLNPMSVFINAYRQVLLAGDAPKFSSLFIGIAISVILFLISYKIFKSAESTFADVV